MFTLIELPYPSLAPVISDQTLAFHYGKHLQAYVDNLNKLVAGTEFEGKSLEEIVRHSGLDPESRGVFNNAGQILNHELYFTQFAPFPSSVDLSSPSSAGLSSPSSADLIGGSPLLKQLLAQWGTLDAFKAEFESKGTTLFGSGWVWLQANEKGELSIGQYANADNPVAHGLKPLLTFDVWEHAYYLDYQNRRAAHLSALWQIVDWKVIETRFER